jgi:hypothetical protein
MYVAKKDGIVDSTTAVVLTSAAVIKKFTSLRQMQVRRAAFGISVATVSNANIVITIKKYVTLGSASNEVTLDTIVIPGGTAAGKVYYVDFPAVATLAVGDELVFEVTTAAAGGGAAGSGFCMFDADDLPEVAGNNSDMVLSA